MTNLEKYQSMTAEEFAEWILLILNNCSDCCCGYWHRECPFKGNCPDSPKDIEKFARWLESEVDAS